MNKVRAACLATALAWLSPVDAADPQVGGLDQNWSAADRDAWYGATQGSRLLPLSWLRALEQPGGQQKFLADANISRFRYLPRPGGQLPVGFAVDDSDDARLSTSRLRWRSGQPANESWVGLNCAACHTAEITYRDAAMRVDGGPTLADFQGLMETLDRSLAQTRDDPDKFSRFAREVLGPEDDGSNRALLKDALGALTAWQQRVAAMNRTEIRYGYGRLDAFGHIYNKVALAVGTADPLPDPSDAPVSYPFLWNVPQLDRLQWNAMAPNRRLPEGPGGQPFDVGALGRNAGEVIGVFADVAPAPGAPLSGYRSSIRVANLVSMEQMLGRLRPPKWPAELGVPGASLAERGKALFDANCQRCHAGLERTDLASPVAVTMTLFRAKEPVGTDPWMACNAYLKHARSGVLEGTSRDYVTGPPTPPDALLADLLATTVIGSLVGEKGEVVKSAAASFFGVQPPPAVVEFDLPGEVFGGVPGPSLTLREQKLVRCSREASGILGYKARPLTGIWATAPYLHNGSVPTLYDLLLPPAARPQQFWTGTREFDPVKFGYVTERSAANDFLFRTRDVQGQVIDGNSNAGHDYGNAALSESDRMALIAYMKTL